MKKESLIWIVILICVLGMIGSCFFYSCHLEYLNNSCVSVCPSVVVGGHILHPAGSSSFILHYKGKREKTGEECMVCVSVTEGEYEKNMYRR